MRRSETVASSQAAEPEKPPVLSRVVGNTRVRVALIWLLTLAAWEACYRLIGWKPWIFPAPSHILSSLLNLLGVPVFLGDPVKSGWPWRGAQAVHGVTLLTVTGSQLVKALLTSLIRLFVGFVLSIAIGAVFALAMWRYRLADAVFGPVLLGCQTLPSVCWVPLAILILGFSEAGILMVLVMGSFPSIAVSLRDGLNSTPPIYQSVGQVFGARRLNFYLHVMLPASLPVVIGGLRTGFSFAWRSLMGGELIFMLSGHGLGYLLSVGREFGDVAQVIAVMAIMVIVATLIDLLIFAPIERGIRSRYGLSVSR